MINQIIKSRQKTRATYFVFGFYRETCVVYLLESIGFPPIEDLLDLSDPDPGMPVSDCLLCVLLLAVIGVFASLILAPPLMGDRGSIKFCWFLQIPKMLISTGKSSLYTAIVIIISSYYKAKTSQNSSLVGKKLRKKERGEKVVSPLLRAINQFSNCPQ